MRMFLRFFTGLFAVAAVWAQPPASADGQFEGTWSGKVSSPNASADLGLTFTRRPAGLTAKFSMPAMFVAGMDLGPAKIVDATYSQPDLAIALTLAGDTLSGTFANPLLRVELHRGGEVPPAPPAPAAPAGPAPAWSRPLGAAVWASPVARDGVI